MIKRLSKPSEQVLLKETFLLGFVLLGFTLVLQSFIQVGKKKQFEKPKK